MVRESIRGFYWVVQYFRSVLWSVISSFVIEIDLNLDRGFTKTGRIALFMVLK